MMKKISININQLASAILTDQGLSIMKKKTPDLISSSWFNKDTRELKTDLWMFMYIFGSSFYVGCTPFFENNRIYLNGPIE